MERMTGYYKTEDIMQMFDKTAEQVRKWARAKTIPCMHIGRRWWFPKKEIDALAKKGLK